MPQPLPGDTRKLTLADPMMTGDDVKAAQQVLHDNRWINFHPGKADRQYGQKTADATRLAKFLRLAGGGGKRRVRPEPEAISCRRARRATSGVPSGFVAPSAARRRLFKADSSVRERFVSWCLWGVENSTQIHFAETRAIPVTTFPARCRSRPTAPGRPRCLRAGRRHRTQRPRLQQQRKHNRDARPPQADHPSQAQPGDLIVFNGDPNAQTTSWSWKPACRSGRDEPRQGGGPVQAEHLERRRRAHRAACRASRPDVSLG